MGNKNTTLQQFDKKVEDGKEAAVMLVDLSQASDEVIGLILKRVPAKELLKACTQVSKQWNRILSANYFWKQKLEEVDGYRLPWRSLAAVQSLNSYQRMAIKQPFQRNFIRDSWDLTRRDRDCCQLDGRWQINNNYIVWPCSWNAGWYDAVRIEVPPAFYQRPKMGLGPEDKPVLACLVAGRKTSFDKRIVIRLADEGLTDELMDTYRPTTVVSELVGCRFDNDTEYRMYCFLSRDEHTARLERTIPTGPIVADISEEGANGDRWMGAFRRGRFHFHQLDFWKLMQHKFKKYTPGMRYLTLQVHAGPFAKLARCSVMALCEGNIDTSEAEEEEAVQNRG